MYRPQIWPDAGLPYPAESAPQGASDLVAALRRGWPLMLACLLAGLSAAAIYVANAPSIYAANTQILFEPKRIEIAGGVERDLQSSIDSSQIESQVQILKSERLSQLVIRAHKLDADPEFTEAEPPLVSKLLKLLLESPAPTGGNVGVAAGEFERRLDVRRMGQSYALDLWFRSTDPAKAARLANAVTAAYVAQQLGETGRGGRGSQFQSSVAELDADRRTAADAVQTGAIDLASFPVADSRVLKSARVPLGRSAPRTGLVLGFAGLLSLLFGASFIVVQQRLRRTILTKRQVEDDLGLPCLCVLPRVGRFRRHGKTMLRVVADRPASQFGRGVNALRAALDAQCDRPEAQCVGVISARPGEGTTSVANNLAHAFATSGSKTLLIDCDPRSDNLSRRHIPHTAAGQADVLQWAELDALKHQDGALALLVAGRQAEANACLIASLQFKAVLDAARKHFDRIVLDLPSIETAPEATITCSWLDATLVVMASGRTTEPMAQSILTTLRRARVSLAGAVLNLGNP